MGYDIWLGNMRGTQYSRGHTTLDSSDPASSYWDFTFAEKGMYDVPAAIEKIKEVSGVDKVAYIGYSQGTTMMFYALTQATEENYLADNMSAFIALAPCMIRPENSFTYDTYISTDWQPIATNVYPNAFGENFDAAGYCTASNNSNLCGYFTYLANNGGAASADIRSLSHFTQISFERRFQAFSSDYDTTR